MSRPDTYPWEETSKFGFEWEEKIFDKIVLAYPNAKRLKGKDTRGDIDTGEGFLLEIKAENISAESLNVCIETGRAIYGDTLTPKIVPSALNVTESRYYIHCDTNDYLLLTPVVALKRYIATNKYELIHHITKRQQKGYTTYWEEYYISYKRMKTISAYGYLNGLIPTIIKKYLK